MKAQESAVMARRRLKLEQEQAEAAARGITETRDKVICMIVDDEQNDPPSSDDDEISSEYISRIIHI